MTERLDALGFDYIEGGYPASNEKDLQYFQQVRKLKLNRIRSLRLRHDPAQGRQGRTGPGTEGPFWTPGPRRSRWSARRRSFRSPRCCGPAREENLAMIAESVGLPGRGRARGDFRRRALLRRLEARPPSTPLRPIRAAAEAGAAAGRALRHQRRQHAGGDRRGHPGGRDRGCRCPWASIATTTATWRWPTRWPPSTPGPRRCRARSTASASAAATPT